MTKNNTNKSAARDAGRKRKTHVTYFVSDGKGQNYNGGLSLPAKAASETVIAATIADAKKHGFHCRPISVTATGCAEPMIARDILE